MSSTRRFLVLGGPGGYLTCIPAGSPLEIDRYRHWSRLFHVRRPLTPEMADAAKSAALRLWEVS